MAGGKPLSHWKKEAAKVSWMSFWNSNSDQRRNEGFRRLSEIGEPAVPALLELFREHDIPVTGDAFNALVNLGPRAASAIPELIEILNDDRIDLRRRSAWILGAIGPAAKPAVPSLARLLHHEDPRLREFAAQALAQIGGSGHHALEQVRRSTDPAPRAASIRGMASASLDSASRRHLIATGLADRNPDVRLAAVELLKSAPPKEREALVDYLVAALNDSSTQVKKAAKTAFVVYRQHRGATRKLLAALVLGGDAEIRADAAWHLGNATNMMDRSHHAASEPAVVNALLAALNDPEQEVRIYAARALANGEGPARIQALRRLRRDIRQGEPILRVRAARVLWDVAHNVDDVKAAYEAGVTDREKWNRVETISAMMHMGKDGVVFTPLLERLSLDPDHEVRDRAGKTLYAIRQTK
ncbi:MAG TPA: HEAT repeat domain-containing protein [Gemmatimonadaceae bacterium]|nr:HEAT repeat domain-containing protein [Gemmatimonadaceae bacterium]